MRWRYPGTLLARVAVATALAAAVGCASSGGEYGGGRPVGSRVIVHRAIEVPPDRDRVFGQGGRVVPERDIYRFGPHCSLEVAGAGAGRALTFGPGSYRVVAVSDASSARRSGVPEVRLAARGAAVGLAFGSGGGGLGMFIWHGSALALEPEREQAPATLRCGYAHEPTLQPANVELVRRALGELESKPVDRRLARDPLGLTCMIGRLVEGWSRVPPAATWLGPGSPGE